MKKITTMIFIIILIIVLGNVSNAESDFDLKSINYNVTLNTDGSMQIIEIWSIRVNSITNKLFKTITLDNERYSRIKNVKVSQITENGREIVFEEKNQEVGQVDKNCYCSFVNSNGQYEIAWGINEKNGEKTYKISYKVDDCIRKYNDTAELYWQFIGKDFQEDINRITGTISVPDNSEYEKTTKAWVHGPLNGKIEIQSANKVKFDLDYFKAGNYLEVRLAMPPEMFKTNSININRMDKIIEEETHFIDKANKSREEYQEENNKETMLKKVVKVIDILLVIVFFIKIIKYKKILKENPEKIPENNSKYYRDIPNEKATPAEVAFLYYYRKTGIEVNLSKVLSSTILDLAMKKFIEIEELDANSKQEQIKIKVLKKDDYELKEDEKLIYNLLKRIQGNADGFNMNELEKYASTHEEVFLGILEKIPNEVKKQLQNEEKYDDKIHKQGLMWYGKGALFEIGMMGAIISIGVRNFCDIEILLIILSAINIGMCMSIARRLHGITQKGIDEKERWEGLKRYLEDYSNIEDKEVSELVIWEKYLVYATVFGIADTVLKQLDGQNSELTEDDTDNSTYLGEVYRNGNNINIINDINNSVITIYNTVAMSSGRGTGGGNSSEGKNRRWHVMLKLQVSQ